MQLWSMLSNHCHLQEDLKKKTEFCSPITAKITTYSETSSLVDQPLLLAPMAQHYVLHDGILLEQIADVLMWYHLP